MTPKEKAQELVWTYGKCVGLEMTYQQAKECALIAVDEIIKSEPTYPNGKDESCPDDWYECLIKALEFWLEVKQEINNLN